METANPADLAGASNHARNDHAPREKAGERRLDVPGWRPPPPGMEARALMRAAPLRAFGPLNKA